MVVVEGLDRVSLASLHGATAEAAAWPSDLRLSPPLIPAAVALLFPLLHPALSCQQTANTPANNATQRQGHTAAVAVRAYQWTVTSRKRAGSSPFSSALPASSWYPQYPADLLLRFFDNGPASPESANGIRHDIVTRQRGNIDNGAGI